MSFAQPAWFWAFALFPLLLGFFLRNEVRRAGLLRQLVASRLLERLAGNVSVSKRRIRFTLLLLSLAAVIVSLAEPRFGYRWEESKRTGRDVLIAIDVSKSMLATDLAPSRLARAKFAAQDLIAQLGGDRVGLIAFAGSAFLQAPLTADFSAVLNSLAEIDTDIIPRGGTNLAEAIRVAVDAFGKGESENRALIIFTDGEELDADGVKAAENLAGAVKIFGVGIGTAEGSLIPIGNGDFVKDDEGQIVKTRLDEARLRKIAELTGGFYVHLVGGPAEMTQIVRAGLGRMTEKEVDTKTSRRPIERYQWPLAAGLALLVLSMLMGERRRAPLAAVALFALLLPTPSARAGEWFATPGLEEYRAGEGALMAKEQEQAQQHFAAAFEAFQQEVKRRPDSPEAQFNLGAAAYQLSREDEAMQAFGKALLTVDPKLSVNAEKNLGHTLFRSGEKKVEKDKPGAIKTWEGALAHYDSALKIDPENGEVRADHEYVQSRIDELKKKEEEKQQDKNQPPKKPEPSEAAKKAKAEADAAVLRREYKHALDIMEKQLKVDATTQAYSDYIQRLQEVNGVPKTNQP